MPPQILDNFVLPTLWQQFGEGPYMGVMVRYAQTFGHSANYTINFLSNRLFLLSKCLISLLTQKKLLEFRPTHTSLHQLYYDVANMDLHYAFFFFEGWHDAWEKTNWCLPAWVYGSDKITSQSNQVTFNISLVLWNFFRCHTSQHIFFNTRIQFK